MPPEGPSTGGWLLGWKLSEWWKDVGASGDLDYRAVATLIWDTFDAVYGAPPRGFTSVSTIPSVPHPLDGPDISVVDDSSIRSTS